MGMADDIRLMQALRAYRLPLQPPMGYQPMQLPPGPPQAPPPQPPQQGFSLDVEGGGNDMRQLGKNLGPQFWQPGIYGNWQF